MMEDENELATPKQEEAPKVNLAKAPEKLAPVATLAPSMFWLKVVRFERRMTASLRIVLAFAASIFFVWASAFIYKELNSNDFMLNSFDVPEEFERQGYKGHILVSKIAIQIASMKKMTRSSYSEDRKYKDKDIGADLNIDVAGMGVSLKSIIEQLRQSLGIERKYINGYVTLHDQKLQLTVTISNRGSEVFEQSLDSMSQYDALEKTLLQASELILQNTDPIVMMNYYFQTKKKGKNIELAKYLLIYEPKYAQWAYLSWASGLRLENDNEGAIEMLKRALEADATLSDAWNSWGSILRNQKKYDEAIEKYQKAIACNPEYLLPYNNLAFVHFLKEEYDMAIIKSNELIAKNEEFGYPYSILAQCYAKKKNEELFYKNLEIALKYKVPVWTWLKTDPWDKYVGQERFDKLIQKYRLD
jgi:tetratricopeptide (TPR) repeat protein